MLPWQPFLAFYIWGAHWRHLKNTSEPSMCGGDAALCQITLPLAIIITITTITSCNGYEVLQSSCIVTVLWIGFCLTGPISLCLELFLHVLCVYYCILYACVGL